MKGGKGHFTSEWKFEGLKMCNIGVVQDELSKSKEVNES